MKQSLNQLLHLFWNGKWSKDSSAYKELCGVILWYFVVQGIFTEYLIHCIGRFIILEMFSSNNVC